MNLFLTRAATGVAALALSVGLLAGTTGPAAAAGCTTAFDTYSTVRKGTTGSKARAVECLLHETGYATTQNASFSSSDADKLKQLQRKHAMKTTGQTNGATWAALISQGSRPSLKHGDTGSDVRRLKQTLRALGHGQRDNTVYDASGARPKLLDVGRSPGTHLAAFSSVEIRPVSLPRRPGDARTWTPPIVQPLRPHPTRTISAVKSVQGKVGLARSGKTNAAVWAVRQNGGRKVPVTSSAKRSTKGAKALAFAKKQLGEKYRYGAAGPNRWDCSGLTMKAWAAAGKKVPHSSKAQYKGKKVSRSDLRPGDLVFFYSGPSHVGVYAGGGKVIHAPGSGKKVSYIKIKYMPWKGARRPG